VNSFDDFHCLAFSKANKSGELRFETGQTTAGRLLVSWRTIIPDFPDQSQNLPGRLSLCACQIAEADL
jgi:hypothetical protein